MGTHNRTVHYFVSTCSGTASAGSHTVLWRLERMIYKRSFGVLSGHFQSRVYSRSLSLHFTATAHWKMTILFFSLSLFLFSLSLWVLLWDRCLFKYNFHILLPHQEINTACKYRSCVFTPQTMSMRCENILRSGGHPASSEKTLHVCLCVCLLLHEVESANLCGPVWACVGGKKR